MVVSIRNPAYWDVFCLFLGFSLMVNPVLNVSLTSPLRVSSGGVMFYASYEAGLTLSNSC